jgi:ABC-2 type transport system permease protein
MILKELRELRRDRRTVGLLVGMPLLLLVIFGYAANFYVSSVQAAVVGPQAEQVAAQLPDFFDVVVVEPSDGEAEAESLLQANTVDVVLVTGQQPVVALVDGSNLFAAQSIV